MNIFKKLANQFIFEHDLRDYENKDIIKEVKKKK